jgi:hypothetical protein
VLTLNSTNVLNNSTVLSLRYGFTTWQDSCDSQPYTPGIQSLGFSQRYVTALGPGGSTTFPSLAFDNVESVGGWGGLPVRWKGPYAINATLTKLRGDHSFKGGFDVRRLGVAENTASECPNGPPALGGCFQFNNLFTSNNGVGGSEVASLLLGAPFTGSVPHDPGTFEWYAKYWGAYFQDDWRVNSKFTLNYGLRLEHETGLQEVNNEQSVAFDQNVTNPLDAMVNKAGSPLAGRTIKGGLIFAGVNGANTAQGNYKTIMPAPRVGATYAIDPRTVFRAGYGLFWAPWNYSTTQHGQIGFARSTQLSQSDPTSEVPITRLDDPFPGGIIAPVGSSLGLLTGAGGQIDFVDQNKNNPHVHQYSADIERELPGSMALTLGYVGAAGRDIGYCGTNDCSININQIDPNLARQLYPAPGGGWDPTKLLESVPNPFFGIAQAGEFGTRQTIQRGQLLRPFPEFGDVFMHESTAGSRRNYNAVTAQLNKRLAGKQNWWGGRFSYTWSRTMDNQYGESSVYQTRSATPQNNYDLQSEYSLSNFDTPHHIIIAPQIAFPSPKSGKGTMEYALLGGWTATAVVELVSGSPLNAVMSGGTSAANLGLFGGLQRPNLIGDPNTSGSDDQRVSTATNPDAKYFTSAAFANPGAGVYGNAPRTDGDARYQFRKNMDVQFNKAFAFSGSQTGEIRFEILNLTNTAKFNGIDSNAINTGSFGRISSQAGFMRIWQLSFRYRF